MFEMSQQLESQVDKQFNHEIKSKRIKKQLHLFQESPVECITIQPVIFTGIGVSIPFLYSKFKQYRFQLRLDKQYPFNRPQIHSLDRVDCYGEGRDLLGEYLDKIHVIWGPSKMLRDLLTMVPEIIGMVEEGEGKVSGKYYNEEPYLVEQLRNKGMKVFKVEEITNRIWGKKRQSKTLAVSQYYILQLGGEMIVGTPVTLHNHYKIQEIKTISADLKTLQMNLTLQNPVSKAIVAMKFGIGTKQQLNQILSLLNPIQMLQKQIAELQKSNQKSQALLKLYTSIIEYYSIKDPVKYDTYMKKMKSTIGEIYK